MKFTEIVFSPGALLDWLKKALSSKGGYLLLPPGPLVHQIRSGLGEAATGWRIMSPDQLAARILLLSGREVFPGRDASLPFALQILFSSEHLPKLEYFRTDLLSQGPGYADAFAATIRELEDAGIPCSTTNTSTRFSDIQKLRKALAHEGRGATLSEAKVVLKKNPELLSDDVVAIVTGTPRPVEVGFLSAIPSCRSVFLGAMPMRPDIETRLGEDTGKRIDAARANPEGRGNLAILRAFLFERPRILMEKDRPKADAPDGSVRIEVASGIEEELEGAAAWVYEEAANLKTPLNGIGILVPDADPYIALLIERLKRLPWPKAEDFPVFAAGGVPALSSPDGARIGTLLSALETDLNVRSVAALLPVLSLKAQDGERRHLSTSQAMTLAWSLGILGGTPGRPEGALEWSKAIARREKALQSQIAELERMGKKGDNDDRESRSLEDHKNTLRLLGRIRPSLVGLETIAKGIQKAASLGDLWDTLRKFIEQYLPSGSSVVASFSERLRTLISDPALEHATGAVALHILHSSLRSLRVPMGNFGDPRIFLGTVSSAVGLEFQTVRILGLAEGSIPTSPGEDPVLPDRERASLKGPALRFRGDSTWESMHDLYRVIQGVTKRVVFSAPRDGMDRQTREPSGVLLEIGAALGWLGTGGLEDLYPGRPPSGLHISRTTSEHLTHMERLVRAAEGDDLGPSDGVMPSGWPMSRVPGISAERAISASRLTTLLECPHRFLFENLLGWKEAEGEPPLGELDPLTFGTLVHEVAEGFWKHHGKAFCAHEGKLDEWITKAYALAESAFAGLMETYPLLGDPVRESQRERLLGAVSFLLEADWSRPPHEFVDVEVPFGWTKPLGIELSDGKTLYVHGYIDRLEKLGSPQTTAVTDVKSGKGKPKKGGPDHRIDVQIGSYTLAVESARGAKVLNVPAVSEAGYVYNDRTRPTRIYSDDLSSLSKAATEWLRIGHGFLTGGRYPRTPVKEDCRFCPFNKVCPEGCHTRAREGMRRASNTYKPFLELKGDGEKKSKRR